MEWFIGRNLGLHLISLSYFSTHHVEGCLTEDFFLLISLSLSVLFKITHLPFLISGASKLISLLLSFIFLPELILLKGEPFQLGIQSTIQTSEHHPFISGRELSANALRLELEWTNFLMHGMSCVSSLGELAKQFIHHIISCILYVK